MQAAAPAVALLVDVRDGFGYMVRTPWLLGTLVRMPRAWIRQILQRATRSTYERLTRRAFVG